MSFDKFGVQKFLQLRAYKYSPLTAYDNPVRGDRVLIEYGTYKGFIGYIDACKHDSWYTVTIPVGRAGEFQKGFYDISRGELQRATQV
jgi:hypothetical protein